MVQATQRLIVVDSASKEFDVYLKYCISPLSADFYQHDIVGEYDGAVTGNGVSIKLKDGRSAYTEGRNVV